MKHIVALAALCLVPMAGAADRETEATAIKLVGIHGKIWGGTEAKREFGSLSLRLRSSVSDIYT